MMSTKYDAKALKNKLTLKNWVRWTNELRDSIVTFGRPGQEILRNKDLRPTEPEKIEVISETQTDKKTGNTTVVERPWTEQEESSYLISLRKYKDKKASYKKDQTQLWLFWLTMSPRKSRSASALKM
jgi:hypothetical protein